MTETKSTAENKGLIWHLGRVNIVREGYTVGVHLRKARKSGQCAVFFWAKIPTTDNPSEHYSVLYRECNGKFMKFRVGGIRLRDIPEELPEKLLDVQDDNGNGSDDSDDSDDIIINISETTRVLYKNGVVYYLKRHIGYYPCTFTGTSPMHPPTDDWVGAELEKLHEILVEGGIIEV